jgi:hypothetical protein
MTILIILSFQAKGKKIDFGRIEMNLDQLIFDTIE